MKNKKSDASKKAQVSIEINWIFVAIAGAIILIFFIGLVYKQKTASEERISGSILTTLEGILTGARVSTDSTQPVESPPKTEINFVCDPDGESWFGVNWKTTGLKKDLPVEVIFAPELIISRNFRVWALEFSAPFKITNMLYIISPETKCVFVNIDDNDYASEIYDGIPAEVSKEKNILNSIENPGNQKIRLVFFDQIPSLPPGLTDSDVTAVNIDSGNVEFYEKQGSSFINTGTSSYLNSNELLYGAIFSDNLGFYECNLKKVMERFRLVASVYADKESELKQYFENTDLSRQCGQEYLEDTLSMIPFIEQCEQNISSCDFDHIIPYINDIAERNEYIKQKSCPLLY